MEICPDGSYYRNGTCYDNRSNWDSYGRWIVVAALVAAGFFIFFAFACITARRRRRAGNVPFRGTGWAAGRTPAGHGPAQYTGAQPYYGNNQQPPPVYGAPQNQPYYGNGNPSNQGYFGGQQSGVELQQPQGAYRPPGGGDSVYNPPAGAPPGKGGDGIIR
ncbi:hypothetical protein MMC07_004909 [Pseudocyphellaria aurata]|nr:hypothetical protein [Pseudocyphellaria aurata]